MESFANKLLILLDIPLQNVLDRTTQTLKLLPSNR
jgi:hypothetical protein